MKEKDAEQIRKIVQEELDKRPAIIVTPAPVVIPIVMPRTEPAQIGWPYGPAPTSYPVWIAPLWDTWRGTIGHNDSIQTMCMA